MVGKEITRNLTAKRIQVRWLSTREGATSIDAEVFHWNPKENYVDPKALAGVDAVIHLAGASVAKRWTSEHKKSIMESRVEGTKALYSAIEQCEAPPRAFISASAVGYYPTSTESFFTEEHDPATDFLGNVTSQWEEEVDKIESLGLRVAKLRIGIVLEKSGGALGQMLPAFKAGIGSPLGSGKQWMPWIHVTDLARMFIHAMENETVQGAYNAAAENQVRNMEFGAVLAKVLNRPYFFPKVPAWALRLLLGEMAQIALMSTHVSVDRIKQTGFSWKYTHLEEALKDVLKK